MRWLASIACVLVACSGGGSDDAAEGDAAVDGAAVDAAAVDAADVDAADVDATVDARPLDAPLIDAAPLDATLIDAAPTVDAAPPDAEVPGTSPWVDLSYGGGGIACQTTGRYWQILDILAAPNGNVVYATAMMSSFYPSLLTCNGAGNAINFRQLGTPLGLAMLGDSSVAAHPTMTVPGAPVTYEYLDLTDFVAAGKAGGHIDFVRGSQPMRRFLDAPPYPELAPLPARPTYAKVWPCTGAAHHLVRTTDSTLILVDAETWDAVPTYQPIAVPALFAVLPDCRVVAVAAAAGDARITRYDASGVAELPFEVALANVRAIAADPSGRLILSMPTTATVDISLARVDLDARALDPAFGTGGIAALDLPLDQIPTGTYRFSFQTEVIGASPGAIAIKIRGYRSTSDPPPMGYVSDELELARVRVAD